MRTTINQQVWLRAGIILTAVAIVFVLDHIAPPELAVEILYLPLILCAAWNFTPKWTWLLYGLCAALILIDAGLDISRPPRHDVWLQISNTIMETLVGARRHLAGIVAPRIRPETRRYLQLTAG